MKMAGVKNEMDKGVVIVHVSRKDKNKDPACLLCSRVILRIECRMEFCAYVCVCVCVCRVCVLGVCWVWEIE